MPLLPKRIRTHDDWSVYHSYTAYEFEQNSEYPTMSGGHIVHRHIYSIYTISIIGVEI